MSNSANFKNFSYEATYVIEKDFLDKVTELLYKASELLSLNSSNYVIKKHYGLRTKAIGKRCQKLSYKILNNEDVIITIYFWLNKENNVATYDCELLNKEDFTLFKVIGSKNFESIYNFLIPYISEHIE